MNRVEIYTSKKKSVLLLLCSLAFVALGVWLFVDAEYLVSGRNQHPVIVRAIGFASVLFFGLGIVISIKRLIKSEVALTMDVVGLNINPKKAANQFIKWNDILGFEEVKIHSTRIVIIIVKNPENWIDLETNLVRKKLMQFNVNNYGSPFNLSAVGLDISFKALCELLNEYLQKYRSNDALEE